MLHPLGSRLPTRSPISSHSEFGPGPQLPVETGGHDSGREPKPKGAASFIHIDALHTVVPAYVAVVVLLQ